MQVVATTPAGLPIPMQLLIVPAEGNLLADLAYRELPPVRTAVNLHRLGYAAPAARPRAERAPRQPARVAARERAVYLRVCGGSARDWARLRGALSGRVGAGGRAQAACGAARRDVRRRRAQAVQHEYAVAAFGMPKEAVPLLLLVTANIPDSGPNPMLHPALAPGVAPGGPARRGRKPGGGGRGPGSRGGGRGRGRGRAAAAADAAAAEAAGAALEGHHAEGPLQAVGPPPEADGQGGAPGGESILGEGAGAEAGREAEAGGAAAGGPMVAVPPPEMPGAVLPHAALELGGGGGGVTLAQLSQLQARARRAAQAI
jgi:hypothetical protein